MMRNFPLMAESLPTKALWLAKTNRPKDNKKIRNKFKEGLIFIFFSDYLSNFKLYSMEV
jgi:hypothetical protein